MTRELNIDNGLQGQTKEHQAVTACISHCWQRVCVGWHFWLPCANSTTKRFDNATAHTRGRLGAIGAEHLTTIEID